jgi:gamma-glutamyltranspeptidase / glutathione hydrolase
MWIRRSERCERLAGRPLRHARLEYVQNFVRREPHKRPFNTLSAGFVMQKGEPLMTVTLMGGDMQAQGHAQMLVDILDLGANTQAAADMARFRYSQVSNTLSLETPLYDLFGASLAAMGHAVKSVSGEDVGGVQSIMRVNGYYRSGSDFRKDGEAVGW